MLKRLFKSYSHNFILKQLAGFGRAMNRLYENRNHDIHSNGELRIIKKIARLEPSVIIDGGANTGNYSQLLLANIPKATIYAFEPVKNTFLDLEKKLAGNTLLHLINKGLYKENTEKEIHLFPSDKHSSIYTIDGMQNELNTTTTIHLVAGDSFAQENKIDSIDFLKLDVEGAEYDALLGFEKMLSAGKIRAIQFEYGYINISTKKLLIDFYQIFEKYGYQVGKIFPLSVEFRPYQFKYEDFLGPNFIAVKKTDTELIDLIR
jgi:FkbM family methyltransferase